MSDKERLKNLLESNKKTIKKQELMLKNKELNIKNKDRILKKKDDNIKTLNKLRDDKNKVILEALAHVKELKEEIKDLRTKPDYYPDLQEARKKLEEEKKKKQKIKYVRSITTKKDKSSGWGAYTNCMKKLKSKISTPKPVRNTNRDNINRMRDEEMERVRREME